MCLLTILYLKRENRRNLDPFRAHAQYTFLEIKQVCRFAPQFQHFQSWLAYEALFSTLGCQLHQKEQAVYN